MTQDQIATILAAIARVETQIVGLGADNSKADKIHEDHEIRIRQNEHYINQQTGEANSVTKARAAWVAIMCSSIGGGLGFLLSHLIR